MGRVNVSDVPTIPSGYANIAVPFHFGTLDRASYITFGVFPDTLIGGPVPVAEAVQVVIDDTWQPAISSSVQIGPVEATVNAGTGPEPGAAGTFLTGGAAINALPSNCALLVQKRTAIGGRSGRGRFFLPWALEESDVSEVGLIDGSTRSDWQDLMDDFLAGLSAADYPMTLLHSGAGDPAAVTSLSVQQVIATQRRRLRG